MKKYLILSIVLLLQFLPSCRKKGPYACIKTTLYQEKKQSNVGSYYSTFHAKTGEEVLFMNCTLDGYTYEWYISSGYKNKQLISTEKDLRYTFTLSGQYQIELHAFNKKGKIRSGQSMELLEVFVEDGLWMDFFVKKFPFRDANGNNWDQDGTGPDIRARFRKTGTNDWFYINTTQFLDSSNININENSFNGMRFYWLDILYDNGFSTSSSYSGELDWLWKSHGDFELLEYDEANYQNFRVMKSWTIDMATAEVKQQSDGQKYVVLSEGEYEVKLLK